MASETLAVAQNPLRSFAKLLNNNGLRSATNVYIAHKLFIWHRSNLGRQLMSFRVASATAKIDDVKELAIMSVENWQWINNFVRRSVKSGFCPADLQSFGGLCEMGRLRKNCLIRFWTRSVSTFGLQFLSWNIVSKRFVSHLLLSHILQSFNKTLLFNDEYHSETIIAHVHSTTLLLLAMNI